MTFAARRPSGRTALLVAAVAAALLASAGWIGLLEPTETRYAEIAREMRVSGDWILPRLNGLPHLHKPPLAYWAAAAGTSITGDSRWGARLAVALASLLTLVFTARIARRHLATGAGAEGPTDEGSAGGALTVALLAGTALFATVGRSLATDPFLTAAVAGFWALAPSPAALALLGVGFLAKGPVVLVPTVLPWLAVSAWRQERPRLGPWWGWLAAAAIALPWYLVIGARVPGLLRWLVEDQLWRRYTTTEHHRAGPPWYFLVVLLAGTLPWTFALVAGIVRAWRARHERWAAELLAWLLLPLAFFSASGSKLPAYLLPCFPAAALLAARGLESPGRLARIGSTASLVAIAAAGWLVLPGVLAHATQKVGAPAIGGGAHVWTLHVSLALFLLAALALRRTPTRAALLVALAWCGLAVGIAPLVTRLASPEALAQELARARRAGEPVVEVGTFLATVPLALGEPVRLLDVPRETGFADPASLGRVVVTADSLTPLLARGGRVWLVGPFPRVEPLARGRRLRLVGAWRDIALGALEP